MHSQAFSPNGLVYPSNTQPTRAFCSICTERPFSSICSLCLSTVLVTSLAAADACSIFSSSSAEGTRSPGSSRLRLALCCSMRSTLCIHTAACTIQLGGARVTMLSYHITKSIKAFCCYGEVDFKTKKPTDLYTKRQNSLHQNYSSKQQQKTGIKVTL